MTVYELMRMLEQCDPDATVMIMHQPGWPFECAVEGLATRCHFQEPAEGDEGEKCWGTFNLGYDQQPKAGNDVFICMGDQLAYGNADAWNAAVKPW